MKNLIFGVCLFFASLFSSFAQELPEAINACNNFLDKDIRTKYTSYDRSAAKAWFYEYFKSDSEKRQSMKKNRRDEFGFNAVVDAVPIGGKAGTSGSSEKDIFSKIETEAINEGYVSNENMKLLITTYVPNEAFTSYNNCLTMAGGVLMANSAGVKASIVSESDDIVILKLEYNSSPAGKNITIANADYTGGDAMHGKKLTPGKIIADRLVIYEQIKRETAQDLTITINFKEAGVDGFSKTISSTTKKSLEIKVPIGTVISSLLPYKAFMEVNGFKETTNLSLLTWVPCDGRTVSSSLYAKNGGGENAPDLRGVFLRGINDYMVPGAGPSMAERLNSEKKVAGEFQADGVKKHTHNQIWGQKNSGIAGTVAQGNNLADFKSYTMKQTTSENEGAAAETRPKNITVYYYIKIN
jgi:hypothetical protein